jgi:hypothetical protein
LPDALIPVDLHHFALNALLAPLMDDAKPPQWTYASVDFSCLPGTTVMVDGKPMVQGEPMPSTVIAVSHLTGIRS